MTASPENIARHELIGLDVTVSESTDPGLASISGRVVDETRNTLLVDTPRGVKRVQKAGSQLVFALPDGRRVSVAGSILISQPENRISKKLQRTRWKL